MPRTAKTPTAAPSLQQLVNFFMTAPIADVRAAVATGSAIMVNRGGGSVPSNGASAPAPRKRDRKPRQTQPALPGTTAATAATANAPATTGAQPARRRPGRPPRPPVAATGAGPVAVPPAVAAPDVPPLPDQGVPDGE